jgi:hypothetical protein
MHDHAPQTGRWLRSVVQCYFNYYAVPTVRPSIASKRRLNRSQQNGLLNRNSSHLNSILSEPRLVRDLQCSSEGLVFQINIEWIAGIG